MENNSSQENFSNALRALSRSRNLETLFHFKS